MGLRANVGNYVYNGMAMNAGAWNTVSYNVYQLNNLSKSYFKQALRVDNTFRTTMWKMLILKNG